MQSNLKLIRSLQPWPPFLPSVRGCVALSRAVADAVAAVCGAAAQKPRRIKAVAVLRFGRMGPSGEKAAQRWGVSETSAAEARFPATAPP